MFFQDFKFYVDILEEASTQQFRHTHRESDYQTWSYEHFITIEPSQKWCTYLSGNVFLVKMLNYEFEKKEIHSIT